MPGASNSGITLPRAHFLLAKLGAVSSSSTQFQTYLVLVLAITLYCDLGLLARLYVVASIYGC